MDSYTRIKGLGLDLQVYRDHSEMGIKQTQRTPFIWFTKEGVLTISGRLIPEYSQVFLYIIEKWMEETGAWNQRDLKVQVDLEYITAQASGILYCILARMNSKCFKIEVDWHYPLDDPYMLELGQILAELLDSDFNYFTVSRLPGQLDRQYRKIKAERDAIFDRMKTSIKRINESSIFLNLRWFDINHNLVQEIKGRRYKRQVREIITMKSKFYELNRQLDQLRLSIMQRDLKEGRELNDDIKQWWANRY